MLDETQKFPPEERNPSEEEGRSDGFAPLSFNPTPYMHHLESSDLSDDQKAELLAILWQIMVGFSDLGFGISPVQQAMDKSNKKETPLAQRFSDVVKSDNNTKENGTRKLRNAPTRQP